MDIIQIWTYTNILVSAMHLYTYFILRYVYFWPVSWKKIIFNYKFLMAYFIKQCSSEKKYIDSKLLAFIVENSYTVEVSVYKFEIIQH